MAEVPCGADKRPLTKHGLLDATSEIAIVAAWRARWPNARWGVPTGQAIGGVVLDVDVKRPEANGYDTLDDFGFGILPNTPMVHTEAALNSACRRIISAPPGEQEATLNGEVFASS
jgi:hypothetical protein